MSSASGAARKSRDDIPFEGGEDRAALAVAAEPGRAAEPCSFEIITTRAGFDALAADWNTLFDRAGRGEQAFQTFNWNWHWCNHYLREGRGQQLAVVTGRRAGRLVMVWPLVTQRVAGLVQLSWMGDPVSQYCDVLMDSGTEPLPQLRAAWANIIASIKPDLVWLPRVREDAAIAPLIAELGAFCAQRRTAMFARREDADTATPSRNRRRSMAKNLAKLGSVAFVQQAGNAAASALALETIAWKRAQLQERGLISPALADPRFDAFFADVAGDAGRPAGCRVVALECDGQRRRRQHRHHVQGLHGRARGGVRSAFRKGERGDDDAGARHRGSIHRGLLDLRSSGARRCLQGAAWRTTRSASTIGRCPSRSRARPMRGCISAAYGRR